MDGGCVFQLAVHDITVCIEVVSIHIWVLVSVESRARVETVGCFPLVGHFILVGVFQPRRGEVSFAEQLSNLVLFEVVHSILIPVAIAVRSVGRIEHIGCTGRHGCIGVAEFEAVWHTVAVRIPVRGAVEKTVAIHVHHEPISLNAKERTDVRKRVEQRLVAILA